MQNFHKVLALFLYIFFYLPYRTSGILSEKLFLVKISLGREPAA